MQWSVSVMQVCRIVTFMYMLKALYVGLGAS